MPSPWGCSDPGRELVVYVLPIRRYFGSVADNYKVASEALAANHHIHYHQANEPGSGLDATGSPRLSSDCPEDKIIVFCVTLMTAD